MSYRDIILVLPTFLYSLLLFSNNVYAMDSDPPPTDLQESQAASDFDENPPPTDLPKSQAASDFDENPSHASGLFLKNEILRSPGAEFLLDICKSEGHRFLRNQLGRDLFIYNNIAAHVGSIGYFLPGGMEELLIVLVHLSQFKPLIPNIEKIIVQFAPEKFPNGKRSEIADKMLDYLDDVCREQRISDKPRQKICVPNYSGPEVVYNITMKQKFLFDQVDDPKMKAWLEDNKCNNAVSGYIKFTDNVRSLFMFEFLQVEDEIQRTNFMKNLFEIIQLFIDLNNYDGAISALTAYQNIKRLAPTTKTENSEKIGGFFIKVLQHNPECLSCLPKFGEITRQYTQAYELYKKHSATALLELCQATSQLHEAKKKCTYSLKVQREFVDFLGAIDFDENAINHLYECVFAENQKFSLSEKGYSEWSTADLVHFFKSHGRLDLFRQLLPLKIIDGATLHEILSGNNDETKNLSSLLKPLLQQLYAGEIGFIKDKQIDNNKKNLTESPTKKNSPMSRNSLRSLPRVSAKKEKPPTNEKSPTNEAPPSVPKRNNNSLRKMRNKSLSSSGSSGMLSESDKSEGPKRKDLQGGFDLLDLENLANIELKLSNESTSAR